MNGGTGTGILHKRMFMSIFIHIFLVGSVKHIFSARVRIGRSRSSKVIDLDMNRNRVCDFLLVLLLLVQVYCVAICLGLHSTPVYTSAPLIILLMSVVRGLPAGSKVS